MTRQLVEVGLVLATADEETLVGVAVEAKESALRMVVDAELMASFYDSRVARVIVAAAQRYADPVRAYRMKAPQGGERVPAAWPHGERSPSGDWICTGTRIPAGLDDDVRAVAEVALVEPAWLWHCVESRSSYADVNGVVAARVVAAARQRTAMFEALDRLVELGAELREAA